MTTLDAVINDCHTGWQFQKVRKAELKRAAKLQQRA